MEVDELRFYASENPNPVLRADRAGFLRYANKAASIILSKWGINLEQRLPEDACVAIELAMKDDSIAEVELEVDEKVFLLRFIAYSDKDYINIYGFDITPRHRYLRRITELELNDELTRLRNKNFLQQKILELGKLQQNCVLYIVDDLNLGGINEDYGDAVGDKVLCAVAERLKSLQKETDNIARLGGDEFALIHTNLRNNNEINEYADSLIADLSAPIRIDKNDIRISVNIGGCNFPQISNQADKIINCARLALARAKQELPNQFTLYRSYMGSVANTRNKLINQLSQALSEDALMVYYQPQVNLQTRSIVGAEALVRWQHDDYGLISPGQFAQLFSDQNLLIAIDDWVLNRACKDMAAWQKTSVLPITLAVNISAKQFSYANVVEKIKSVLAKNNIAPQSFAIEITESVLIDDIEQAIDKCRQLVEMGIEVIMDDFGTGYSSLSYLQKLPISKVKIDKSFISEIENNPASRTLVETIITMAKNLGKKVLAEGVETEQQADILQRQHCEEIQGFYISQAVPSAEFLTMIRSSE